MTGLDEAFELLERVSPFWQSIHRGGRQVGRAEDGAERSASGKVVLRVDFSITASMRIVPRGVRRTGMAIVASPLRIDDVTAQSDQVTIFLPEGQRHGGNEKPALDAAVVRPSFILVLGPAHDRTD